MTYRTTLWRCEYRVQMYGQYQEPCYWSAYADERPGGCPLHAGRMARFGEFELEAQ